MSGLACSVLGVALGFLAAETGFALEATAGADTVNASQIGLDAKVNASNAMLGVSINKILACEKNGQTYDSVHDQCVGLTEAQLTAMQNCAKNGQAYDVTTDACKGLSSSEQAAMENCAKSNAFYNVTTGQCTSLWTKGGAGAIYYNAGNVGIGTNNPAKLLDVNGTIRAAGGLQFGDGSTQNTAAMSLGPVTYPNNGPQRYPEWTGPYEIMCPGNKVMVGVKLTIAGTCHKECRPDGPIIQNIQVICR